jgi:hypothetical protein
MLSRFVLNANIGQRDAAARFDYYSIDVRLL